MKAWIFAGCLVALEAAAVPSTWPDTHVTLTTEGKTLRQAIDDGDLAGGPQDALDSVGGGAALLAPAEFSVVLDPHAGLGLKSLSIADGDAVALGALAWQVGSIALADGASGAPGRVFGYRGNVAAGLAPWVVIGGSQGSVNACLRIGAGLVQLCSISSPTDFFVDRDLDGVLDAGEALLGDLVDTSGLLLNHRLVMWQQDTEPDRVETIACTAGQDPDQPGFFSGVSCDPFLNSGQRACLLESEAGGGTAAVCQEVPPDLAGSVTYRTDAAGVYPRAMTDLPASCQRLWTGEQVVTFLGGGDYTYQPLYTARGDEPDWEPAGAWDCSCMRKTPGLVPFAQCSAQFDLVACAPGAASILDCGAVGTPRRLVAEDVRCSEGTFRGPPRSLSGWCEGATGTACTTDGACGANGPCRFGLRDGETVFAALPNAQRCTGGTQDATFCSSDGTVAACIEGGGECSGQLVCFGGTAPHNTPCDLLGADPDCTGGGECRPVVQRESVVTLCGKA